MFGGLIIPSPIGTITALSCGTATNNGTLTSGTVASGVNSVIPYTGGNGGTHLGQVVTSTGVTGLTATLTASTFAIGTGSLTYTITGTPANSGTASFALNIGGQACTLIIIANATYPVGTVYCLGIPTAVVDVTNPTTGKVWMDRNLGAVQKALSSTDSLAYGDLYQWGRGSDGHQCRNSPITSTLSSANQPGNSNFIISTGSSSVAPYYDWRSPQNNNLWQGLNGTNNPCPTGYRLPTLAEFSSERASWTSQNAAGAFSTPLKFTLAGNRGPVSGISDLQGSNGNYWSSTIGPSMTTYSAALFFNSSAGEASNQRARGLSVRCIKN
jgi:uncharacterized protein (TIGR02145 family)